MIIDSSKNEKNENFNVTIVEERQKNIGGARGGWKNIWKRIDKSGGGSARKARQAVSRQGQRRKTKIREGTARSKEES